MNYFLESEKIGLRSLEANDLNENYLSWLNNQETSEQNSHAYFPYTIYQLQQFYSQNAQNKNLLLLAIISKSNNKHIGNISLQNINWIYRNAEFAILLGEKEYWGKGISFEAATLIIRHGFTNLNLHRIYCGTTENNIGMKKLATKLGMQQEGIRRDAFFKQNTFQNIFEYGILQHEFTL